MKRFYYRKRRNDGSISTQCAPGTEPPGVLRIEVGKIPKKGVQSED